ncbi:helix-turn-helix domain-containing protein [Rhodococcus hoagii]|nr:helix-turn-helix domain-containing protein [Prescottella equi]
MSASPWHTVQSAAEYARKHPNTIYAALIDEELEGDQRKKPKGHWRIHQDALDRWLRGEPPAKPRGTPTNSSPRRRTA